MNIKDKIQEEIRQLSLIYPFLAIQAATGVGKGLAVMKCIDSDNSGLKWLILVPEILQIQNLKDDIKKHNMEHLYNKIEDIICYASFESYKGKEVNLWLNEVHRLSELKADISTTIRYEKIIVDSATIPFKVKDRLSKLEKFHYFKLSLQEAIEKGVLPEPVIYKVGIKLDKKLKRNEAKYGKNTYLITDEKYAEKLDSELEYWKKRFNESPKEDWIGGKLNKIGSERKNFFS